MMRTNALMAVRNGAEHLQAALDSIYAQTFRDFTLLVVDDASTDDTAALLAAQTDPRLVVLRNERHLGLTRSLNRGVAAHPADLILRMDADDLARPDRFLKQVEFLRSHPRAAAAGSFVDVFGAATDQWRPPTTPDAIKAALLFENTLYHPTLALWTKPFQGGPVYDESFPRSQDYELVERLSADHELAVVPEALLNLRIHAKQIGALHADEQVACADRIRVRSLGRLGIDPTPDEAALHSALARKRPVDLSAMAAWLEKIARAGGPAHQRDLAARKYEAMQAACLAGESVIQTWRAAKPGVRPAVSAGRMARLLVKSLFGRRPSRPKADAPPPKHPGDSFRS